MTLAPLFARSSAVSLPIPVLAPVIITVLPSIRLLLLQGTPITKMYLHIANPTIRRPQRTIHIRGDPDSMARKVGVTLLDQVWPCQNGE